MNNYKKRSSILIFDSGIGGLSIYKELYKKMPHLHYIYLFDNEMFPYGDKTGEFLIDRVKEVIKTVTKTYKIDLAVIACNTASTLCLPTLRAQFTFPIVGVVPAIKPATEITVNRCIGLLATKATIKRAYTSELISQFATNCKVELLGLSELALIAEKKIQGFPVNLSTLEKLMQPWLALPIIPDTIVLGCTHYPFIKTELQQIFPQSTFIDSGIAVANRVGHLLNQQVLSDQDGYKIESNIVLSTLYNEHVEKIIVQLQKYNFYKYQLINIIDG